jgi:GH35 family endo-1,4-beta-xylanase
MIMKQYKSIIVAAAALAVVSCADEKMQAFQTVDPNSEHTAQYAYLNDYADLKSYTNPKASSTFKLGGAMEAGDFNKKEQYYALGVANFNEIVAGNAMKMASCIGDKGEMNFTTVTEFVNNATEAGLNVYGHTLAWHAQQPVKWLNSLLADREIVIDPDEKVNVIDYSLDCGTLTHYDWTGIPASVVTTWGKDGTMEIYNPEPIDPWYVLQYWLVSGISLTEGKEYTMKINMRVEGESSANIRFKLGSWGGGYEKSFTVDPSADFQEIVFAVTPTMASNGLFFQHGDFAGTVIFKSIEISHSEAPVFEKAIPIINNGDAEGDDVTNFYSAECQLKGNNGCNIAEGVGYNGTRGFVVDGTKNPSAANNWDTQFFVYASEPLKVGDKIHFSFRYRADVAAGSECQTHHAPGAYIFWNAGNNLAVNFTNEWQVYDMTFVITEGMLASDPPSEDMQTFAWNLAVLRSENKYYFDDIVMEKLIKTNTDPLTPQEKKDTLTWAMDKWIKGMMEACEGKVKAWDVVNEAISGGDPTKGQIDAEGVYKLQHADEENPDPNSFFWQDYLDDYDYVRTAVKLAREYGPEDIKLFINDYNLESNWDDNGKLKSLIKWIERWESDGVTKIDGIGTQMHISCYADEAVQNSKKNAIVNMLTLMENWCAAGTGRYARISELDMAYVSGFDADGKDITVKTPDMTEEQHHAMADLYQFVIEKYFEIIKPEHQWGICQWCLTDSPANSHWRPGLATGLWSENFYRKHTYAGFANGLAGK